MAIIYLNHHCSLSAFSAILSIPEASLHHFEYELRHPFGIYKNSLLELVNLFQASLSALSRVEKEYREYKVVTSFGELLEVYKELLFRLRQFIDDCYLIMQAISPVNEKYYPKIIFSNQYLLKIKFPGFRAFERIISPYKNEHVGAIVNSIKHKQRQLRGMFFYSQVHDNLFIPGYYVEGISTSGMLAPCRSVHRDENSAFSFNRDLKVHIWNLFAIDKALHDAIISAKDVWGIKNEQRDKNVVVHGLINIVERISNLPHEFYDDEQRKPTVSIVNSEGRIKFEFPYKKGIKKLPKKIKIVTMPTVDMSVPRIKMPYYKPEA